MPFTWDTIIHALENLEENGTVKDVREWLSTCTSSSTELSALPGEIYPLSHARIYMYSLCLVKPVK